MPQTLLTQYNSSKPGIMEPQVPSYSVDPARRTGLVRYTSESTVDIAETSHSEDETWPLDTGPRPRGTQRRRSEPLSNTPDEQQQRGSAPPQGPHEFQRSSVRSSEGPLTGGPKRGNRYNEAIPIQLIGENKPDRYEGEF